MGERGKKGRAEGQINLLGTAGTMGMHMVSGPIVGFALGCLADKWLDSWPFGAGAGILLGLAAGFRNVWEDARYLSRANEENDRKKKQEEEGKSREERSLSAEKRTLLEPDAPFPSPSVIKSGNKHERSAAALLAGTAEPWEKEFDELEEALNILQSKVPENEAESEKNKHGHN